MKNQVCVSLTLILPTGWHAASGRLLVVGNTFVTRGGNLSKKTRKKEKNNSTKKAINKKRKQGRKQELDQESDQENKKKKENTFPPVAFSEEKNT